MDDLSLWELEDFSLFWDVQKGRDDVLGPSDQTVKDENSVRRKEHLLQVNWGKNGAGNERTRRVRLVECIEFSGLKRVTLERQLVYV